MGELEAARRWAAGAWVALVAGGWVATQALETGIEPTNGPRPAGHAPPSVAPITLPDACPSRPRAPAPAPTAYPVPPSPGPLEEPTSSAQFYTVEIRDAVNTEGSANCVTVTTR
ncbi:hypothetical protein [Streptomyces sp. NPDC016845]|uniref:hypothetical protein n=1 Tax=Streptomyces sp. NPDC016845 TaxID=3364972 RepID=UPI0037B63F40